MSDRHHPANLLLRVGVVGLVAGLVVVGGLVTGLVIVLVGVILVGVSDALNRYRLRKMITRYERVIPTTPERVILTTPVRVWDLLVEAQGWSKFYSNAHFVELTSRRVHRSTGGSALEWAGRLLPEAMAEEYIEEWRAWLADLQEAGEPWYRRTAELLVIVLVAAPRLAIICRLPRKTVD